MNVSIIIPCYNSAKTITALVRSVLEQRAYAPDDELLVIDDCSTDESSALATEAGARVITMERNGGPSLARNRGVAEAKHDLLVFLDSDTWLEPGALERIKSYFAKPDALMCLNGRCSDIPLRNAFGCGYKALVEYCWHEDYLRDPKPITCFNTRIGAMRRQAFQDSGGFDGRYKKAEVEDYEFSYRLIRHHPIAFDGGLMVRHDFPDFRGILKVYWIRAVKWAELFYDRRAFDGAGTTANTALAHLLGAAFPLFLLGGLVWAWLSYLGLLLMLTFFWHERRLFKLFWQKLGFFGLLSGVAQHLLYSYVILAGVAYGLLKAMKTKLGKLRGQTA
ncbi:MAG: glycosyltransferase family 2 protein [Alphaproteobacteria bacterium]|nr:glycosyltransferase family 2 protein [Alphaproteobacteria bacterium]